MRAPAHSPGFQSGVARPHPFLSPFRGDGVAAVRKYIQQQEAHHKRVSFKDELISLLRKHRIEFDEDDHLE